MRCCKHYSPAANDMERHDGLQINDAYEFDKLLPHPSCTNAEITGGNPFGACGFARNQDKCNYYEPETPHVLKSVMVKRLGSPDVEVRLEIARVTFGIVEFYISHVTPDTRAVQHTVNAHEHAEKSRDMANELFDYELKKFGAEAELTALPPEDNTDNSYLLEVTDAVRIPA